MERRAEPRFPINSPVRVTLLGPPDRDLDCRITDISATGMRLVANERLLEDKIIALKVDDHFVVAVIRTWQREGDKYAMGAERIQAMDKDTLPPGNPKVDEIRNLLVERGWRLESEVPPRESPVALEEARESAREAALRQAAEEAKPARSAPPSRSWRVPLSVAASLAIGIPALVYFLEFRSRAGTGDSHPAPAASAPPVAMTAPVEATPAVETKGPGRSGTRHVKIQVEAASWVAATVDGKQTIAEIVPTGGTREFDFSRIARLRLGAANGVKISVDGQPVEPLGRRQLRLLEFTPAGVRLLPWTNSDPPGQTNE
jgi:hypothetical protein